MSVALLALALSVPAPLALQDGPQDGALVLTTFALPEEGAGLAFRDADGDGLADVLRVDAAGVALRRQRPDGTFPAQDDAVLLWPGTDLAWEIGDLGGDGAVELLLLLEGRRLVLQRVAEDGAFAEPFELLSDAGGSLPRGIRRLRMLRDVDGDGRMDVVVPGRERYRIFRGRPEGGLASPLEVRCEARVFTDVGDPERLHSVFAQSVSIPWFELRDVDGDGRNDLVAESEDAVFFHLARPELPSAPTWSLDLAALREEEVRTGVDLENLFANLDPFVTWRVADLDGVPPADLVVQRGGTFRIWRGGAADGAGRNPDQVLKASGNVLHYLLRDVAGDELPELQIIRGDKVSLGQIARWLVLPGALNFDVFTYANEGGTFGRKPARQSRVVLEIPRLLAFAEEFEDTKDELESRLRVPARRLDLDGDGAHDDVVDLLDGRLLLFRDGLPPGLADSLYEKLSGLSLDGLLESYILRDLDRLEDGGRRVIELAQLRNVRVMPGWDLRQATNGKEPSRTLALPEGTGEAEIHVTDLNGNARSDLVLVGEVVGVQRLVHVVVR